MNRLCLNLKNRERLARGRALKPFGRPVLLSTGKTG
jgi:hypothetical protein